MRAEDTRRGGRHVANERSAFDADQAPATAAANMATAPLYECAAAHDGQPPDAWLRMLYRMYGDLH